MADKVDSATDIETVHAVLRWASQDRVDPSGQHRCQYCGEPEGGGHMSDCWVGDAFAALARIAPVVEAARRWQRTVDGDRQADHDASVEALEQALAVLS